MSDAEIQLWNDLTKVGLPIVGTILGTLLGAVSTYFVTRLNHSAARDSETTKKRLELVLQSANDVAEFEHLIGSYATAISNQVQGLAGGIDIEEARRNLLNRNQPLRRARMTLKILGLKEADAHLEAYVELTREVISRGPYQEGPRASELAKIIVRGPVQFYSSLASEFPKGQQRT